MHILRKKHIIKKEVILNMNKGYLTIRLTTANSALPVSGAKVEIFDMNDQLLGTLSTDDNGISPQIELPCPPEETQFDSNLTVKPYSIYKTKITATGYTDVIINGVQIYDKAPSYLPIDMELYNPEEPSHVNIYNIGDNALVQQALMPQKNLPSRNLPQEDSQIITPRIHREVFIPTHIRVHLGVPTANARNIIVPFIDYIKNVASSEIFPDWPYHSLRANIHAQISIALNRVFTEWYRSKGLNFDITNSTQFDQYFVEGRNIYQSVSVIADEIFNTYINRPPGIEPLFAEYCNGTTVTCAGLKQWGTVTLANQGRNYLDILRYYYGPNTSVRTTNNIQAPFESFRSTLTIGSSGNDVTRIQSQLARIRRNYPRIPAIPIDGIYGSQTAAAVREFQTIFGLPATGTVDRSTWFKINLTYLAVAKLAELGSEGHIPPTISPPSGYFNYTVVSGDSIWSLAQRFGTTVDAIMSLNGLTSSSLSIGQVLRIPSSTVTTPPPSGFFNYTVVSGDSLWALAQRFGTTVDAIMSLNGLTSSSLRIGQVLRIPT